MKTYRFVALPPRTPGTPGRRGWPRQWRPRPRAASRGIACRRWTPTFPTQRFRFTHPGFHASWLLLSLRNINLIFYYRTMSHEENRIRCCIVRNFVIFLSATNERARLILQGCGQINTGRDRIAEIISRKPKIFRKRNAASILSPFQAEANKNFHQTTSMKASALNQSVTNWFPIKLFIIQLPTLAQVACRLFFFIFLTCASVVNIVWY